MLSTGRPDGHPLDERPNDRAEAVGTSAQPDVAEDVTQPRLPLPDPDPHPAEAEARAYRDAQDEWAMGQSVVADEGWAGDRFAVADEESAGEQSALFDEGWAGAQSAVAEEATRPHIPLPEEDRYSSDELVSGQPTAAWGAYGPPDESIPPAPPAGPPWTPGGEPPTLIDAPAPRPKAKRRRPRIDLLPIATLVVALFWLWVLLFRLTGGGPVGATSGSAHRIVWAVPTLAPSATATATPHPLKPAVLSAFGGGDSATQQCPAPGSPGASQPLGSLGVYIDNTRSTVPVYWWVDIHDPLPGPGSQSLWASASDPFGTLPAGKATWATVYPDPNLCHALQAAGITTPTAFHAYVGVGGVVTSVMTDVVTPPAALTPTPTPTPPPTLTP